MQLLCSSSEVGSDVRCPVCGQGFLMYWTRKSPQLPQEQPILLSVIIEALGRHHKTCTGTEAHPFHLPLEDMTAMSPSTPRFAEPQWGYC